MCHGKCSLVVFALGLRPIAEFCGGAANSAFWDQAAFYHIYPIYLSLILSFDALASADVKMSGYQRQSVIALDRYDPQDRALRELLLAVERRVRSCEGPWRRFRRQAWEAFSENGNRTKENQWR
jgi:hypothetical protein